MIPPAVHEAARNMQALFPYFVLTPRYYWHWHDDMHETRFDFAYRIQPDDLCFLTIWVGKGGSIRTADDLKAQLEASLQKKLFEKRPNPRQLEQLKRQYPDWWQS